MNKKNNKTKYIIIGLILIAIAAIGVVVFVVGGDNGAAHITVERKDIVQSVLAAGNTRAVDSAELGFEQSGRVIESYVDVGSRVVAGQLLIELDSSELKANLLEAQAKLAEDSAGVVTENIALLDALQNAKVVLANAFISTDNVIRNNIDQFFNNPGGGQSTNFDPQIQNDGSSTHFPVSFNDRIEINTKRKAVQKELEMWQSEVALISDDNVESLLYTSQSRLISARSLIDLVSDVIFEIDPPNSSSISIVATFKSDVASARTTITTLLANIVSAQEKLNLAKASQIQSDTPSGTTSTQDARKLQLQAQIQSIQSQIARTRLYAPFDGVVTKQELKKGEIATSGQAAVSIISDNKLEIESNISEVNIGKIAIGNMVSVTFDAYPGEIFLGTVSYIDPGETMVDGVVNYKIKVVLSNIDPKIKSGLTANLTIETAKKSNALTIPLFAVITRADGTYVKKVVGESVEEVPVRLGIVGQDGSVEVLSSLEEGDSIEAAPAPIVE